MPLLYLHTSCQKLNCFKYKFLLGKSHNSGSSVLLKTMGEDAAVGPITNTVEASGKGLMKRGSHKPIHIHSDGALQLSLGTMQRVGWGSNFQRFWCRDNEKDRCRRLFQHHRVCSGFQQVLREAHTPSSGGKLGGRAPGDSVGLEKTPEALHGNHNLKS